jgi:hypothetical protein
MLDYLLISGTATAGTTLSKRLLLKGGEGTQGQPSLLCARQQCGRGPVDHEFLLTTRSGQSQADLTDSATYRHRPSRRAL